MSKHWEYAQLAAEREWVTTGVVAHPVVEKYGLGPGEWVGRLSLKTSTEPTKRTVFEGPSDDIPIFENTCKLGEQGWELVSTETYNALGWRKETGGASFAYWYSRLFWFKRSSS